MILVDDVFKYLLFVTFKALARHFLAQIDPYFIHLDNPKAGGPNC